MMGEVRYQKECVVAQRFPATGKCPTLKAAGGMGVTGVIRNGKWGSSGKSCTNGGDGPGYIYGKGVRDLGFSLVPALPSSAFHSSTLRGNHLARESGNVVSFENLQKGQGMQRMDLRTKR